MKILYLTNKPVYPVRDGGCFAMRQFLTSLKALDCQIDHICIETEKHPFKKDAYPKHYNIRSIESVFVDTRIKPFDALINLIQSKSYNLSRFFSPTFLNNILEKLDKSTYTHIIFESIYLTPYLSKIRKKSDAKIIVRTHNVEFKLWEQTAFYTKNPIKKWYLKKLTHSLRKEELHQLNCVDSILSICSDDCNEFINNGIQTPINNLPVSIDISELESDKKNNDIFFLGAMNWQPNVTALKKLKEDIFPQLKIHFPEIKLHIAGSYLNNNGESIPSNDIQIYGFVKDIDSFMASKGILILPFQLGSGVRIKILEAMALGVPILTNQIGAYGLEASEGLYIGKNDQEMLKLANELLSSEEKRIEIGKKAKAYIKKHHDFNDLTKKLNEYLQ